MIIQAATLYKINKNNLLYDQHDSVGDGFTSQFNINDTWTV